MPAPEWKTEMALDRIQYMSHSSEFNETIPLIENSNHISNKINKFIPIVAYITARPETTTVGTIKWLLKNDFPKVELINRINKTWESNSLNRNAWKAKVLSYLYPEVIGIVDDDYGLLAELEKLDYKGVHYLYGKQREEIKSHKNLVICPTWQDVLVAVTRKDS